MTDTDHFELIEGEILPKAPKTRPRSIVTASVRSWLSTIWSLMHLNPDAPVRLSSGNEPEPVLAVLKKPATAYPTEHPPASDILLVIEISDSTLAFDLGPKARLYARAEIPEYWVFDIGNRRLIVHRAPQAGLYWLVSAYAEGESISPLAMPSANFPVSVAFPFPAGSLMGTF